MLVFVILLIFQWPVLAQHDLLSLYDSLFQTENTLIYGKEYKLRYPQSKGHPFFGDQSWRSGFVKVHRLDLAYDAIRYDLLNDHLLVQHFSESGSHVIQIDKQYASEFHLDGHHFCYLNGSGGSGSDLEPGYYEAAYGSGPEIWIRWRKIFSEGSQGRGQYDESRVLYIKNGHRYFRITNRKSLLEAFPDRDEKIRAYLKDENIVVRRADLEELAGVVRYYAEQLK